MDTTVIEINGIKLEVDLRTAKRIDTLRIGDRVKCLVKKYNEWETLPGVVVGFEPFDQLPTIVVAYLDRSYPTSNLILKSVNAQTKDFEIVVDIDRNALEIDKGKVLDQFETELRKKRLEIEEIEMKRVYFLKHFARYFPEIREPENA